MEDEIKYAVYIVVVEDSERTDMAISQFVDTMEMFGELDYETANNLLKSLTLDARDFFESYA